MDWLKCCREGEYRRGGGSLFHLLKGRRGSFALEAALFVPIALTLIFFILNATRLVREDCLLRYAVDQTAEEAALLITAADSVALAATDKNIETLINKVIPLSGNKSMLLSAAKDLGKSRIFAGILHSRIDYWLDDARVGMGLDSISHRRRVLLLGEDEHNCLWMAVPYTQYTILGKMEKTIYAAIPLWNNYKEEGADAAAGDEEGEGSSIWNQSNFTRGRSFRKMYGENLPYSFPVIAAWNGGEALSIKSMDLTAPSYTDSNYSTQCVEDYVRDLAAFSGASRSYKGKLYEVSGTEISSRRLLLVIPENTPAWLSIEQQNSWRNMARAQGVTLDIRTHGRSMKYSGAE